MYTEEKTWDWTGNFLFDSACLFSWTQLTCVDLSPQAQQSAARALPSTHSHPPTTHNVLHCFTTLSALMKTVSKLVIFYGIDTEYAHINYIFWNTSTAEATLCLKLVSLYLSHIQCRMTTFFKGRGKVHQIWNPIRLTCHSCMPCWWSWLSHDLWGTMVFDNAIR